MLSTPTVSEKFPLKPPMIAIRAVSVSFSKKMYSFYTCGSTEPALLLVGCGLCPVVVSGGYSPVEVSGPLIALASLVAEPRIQGRRLQELWPVGSVDTALRLSCPTACGIFPEQGSNPCPLHRQAGC